MSIVLKKIKNKTIIKKLNKNKIQVTIDNSLYHESIISHEIVYLFIFTKNQILTIYKIYHHNNTHI